jgi:haloacetate dehalogenase
VFPDLEVTRSEGNGAWLRVRYGGSGPAGLLLRGHPRTHVTWHRVAPLPAAAGHTVVCPGLRGYGESGKPHRRAAQPVLQGRHGR